jgi:hypothetical protein
MTPDGLIDKDVESFSLDKIQIGMEQAVTAELLQAHGTAIYDDIFRTIRLQIRGYVLGERMEDQSRSVTYPATWWDAFKERWFPKRALKRWPAKRTTFTVDVKVIYPELHRKISLPDERHTFLLSSWMKRPEDA